MVIENSHTKGTTVHKEHRTAAVAVVIPTKNRLDRRDQTLTTMNTSTIANTQYV